ncbi:MAG: hypothetical protein QXT45_07655 [Candidatus Bilamarchaeaceae archaeon]
MPRNKIVVLTTVAHNNAITIQPPSGERWLLYSVESPRSISGITLQRTNGSTHVDLLAVSGYTYLPIPMVLSNTLYARVHNASGVSQPIIYTYYVD